MVWGQVAEGWVIATNEMWKHPLATAKAIKKDFARVAKEHNIQRVQTGIRKDFKQGIRFAEWLGLEREGLMRKWGFDGSDQYMYARIILMGVCTAFTVGATVVQVKQQSAIGK